MAPIKGKSTKIVKRRATRVPSTSKNEPNDTENDSSEESTRSKLDNYVDQSQKNQYRPCFKFSSKADSEKFESSVRKLFSDSEEEDIFGIKSENKEDTSLHDSMKNLKISDTKGGHPDTQKCSNSIQMRTRSQLTKSHVQEFQKNIKSSSARKTRNNSANSKEYQSPIGIRLINKTPRNENITPSTERCLRSRDQQINYNENKSVQNSKKRCNTKKASSENGVYETPKKQGMQLRQLRKTPLVSVDKESKQNDCNYDFLEESSPVVLRKSARRRKSVDNLDNEFSCEETPKTRKITITSTATTGAKRLLSSSKSAPKSSREKMTPKVASTLTPSMQQRSVHVSKPKSNLQEFRTRLHVSFVPKSLPCREVEFNNIFTFLKGKLTEQIGGCIYISGVPGTGKTATVNEAISCLKKLESQGELPKFEFVSINGMKLTEPRQAYVQIKKEFTGTVSSWEESHYYLQHRFTVPESCRNMTLLLIDEMDLLCTKRQDVVYNLLDWPTYKSSHLVVITIANTMDLPERVLMGRVTSRLGLTRLTFQPYNHIQLMEIVKTRLKNMNGFRVEAIELVARKVASVSGDARRALDICRRAAEIAEGNNKEFVTILDVTSALKEMIANPRVQAIKCCSLMERKFLEAVCNEVSRIGMEQVTLSYIYKQFETLCLIEGEEVPNISQTLEICRKLASWRLILWESGADLYQNILLNVGADDIYFSRHKTH